MGKYTALIQSGRFVSGKEMFQGVHNKETASSLTHKYKKRNIIVQVRRMYIYQLIRQMALWMKTSMK